MTRPPSPVAGLAPPRSARPTAIGSDAPRAASRAALRGRFPAPVAARTGTWGGARAGATTLREPSALRSGRGRVRSSDAPPFDRRAVLRDRPPAPVREFAGRSGTWAGPLADATTRRQPLALPIRILSRLSSSDPIREPAP